MAKTSIVVPFGCGAADVVKTILEGFSNSKICVLLKELRDRSKNNNVELFFLDDRKYHVRCNEEEGIIDVPQEITTMGLMLMMEYLNRSPLICNTCKVCFKKVECPKTLFV